MIKILKKHQCRRLLLSLFIILTLLLVISVNSLYAQAPVEELSGWFSIDWGDSKDGKSSMEYMLTDANGKEIMLQLDKTVAKELGGVLQFNGKFVSVKGISTTMKSSAGATLGSIQTPPAVIKVISISPAPLLEPQSLSIEGVFEAAVSGAQPWVTLMCQFSDVAAQPNDVAYFNGMYSDTEPGLNHYWKELSFDIANIDGSGVGGTGWYTINSLSTWNPTLCVACIDQTDRSEMFDACVAAADADVDFSQFVGINLMFNADFATNRAYGGQRTRTLDGENRSWAVTWEPPWSYHDISVISHEMGHGFGLPHSTAIMRDPDNTGPIYDHVWDVMSDDRYNCPPATDPTYGCMAQHTISYHKDMLDWILPARKTSVGFGTSTTVILEDLAAPASANYQMVKIPIAGSATHFYTVEARKFTGYDVKLPDEAVIVHDVDTTEEVPALLAPAGLSSIDPDVMWTVGETFIDEVNNIAVIVNSDTGSGFEVTISNGDLPPVSDANGPYEADCQGSTTGLVLDGTGSSDPEGEPLSYDWDTDCPGGSFDDNTSPEPILSVDSSNGCYIDCNVSLTVTDDAGLTDESESTITVSDINPPDIICPADITIECDQSTEPSNTGLATGTDDCDSAPVITWSDVVTPGDCPNEETITRTWMATDYCGNAMACVQTIEVVDTTPPVIVCNVPATIIPSDAPISFISTATDNCDNDDPSVEITDYDCFNFTKKGMRIDKTESCIVSLEGDTINIIDSGGVGDIISWTAISTDDCANTTELECTVDVVRKMKP